MGYRRMGICIPLNEWVNNLVFLPHVMPASAPKNEGDKYCERSKSSDDISYDSTHITMRMSTDSALIWRACVDGLR